MHPRSSPEEELALWRAQGHPKVGVKSLSGNGKQTVLDIRVREVQHGFVADVAERAWHRHEPSRVDHGMARSPYRGDVIGPVLHQRAPALDQVGAGVGGLHLVPVGVASAASITAGGASVASDAQSRNDERNPCGTAAMPFLLTSWLTAASESCLHDLPLERRP